MYKENEDKRPSSDAGEAPSTEKEETVKGVTEGRCSEVGAIQRLTYLDGIENHEDPNAVNGGESQSEPSDRRTDILKALEAVERDSLAIADSYSSLFASLRISLSQATSSTVDHMNCFSDAAGRLQECVLDASTKGNRYINSCLRLNEEMKGAEALATKLKTLRRHVDALDSVVNRLVRPP